MFPVDHVSPSMLFTWMLCGQKFVFKYLERLFLPKNVSVHIGMSAHKSCEKNHDQKKLTRIDLSEEELKDISHDAYVKSIAEGVFLTKEEMFSKGKIIGQGQDTCIDAVGLYSKNVAPTIMPKGSEKTLKADFGFGLPLLCRSDVINEDDNILDFKFGSRKNQDWADNEFQATFNVLLYKETMGLDYFPDFIYHNIVTNKTVVHNPLTTKRSQADVIVMQRYIELFLKDMVKGIYKPAIPGKYPCIPKWCEYYHVCPFVK